VRIILGVGEGVA